MHFDKVLPLQTADVRLCVFAEECVHLLALPERDRRKQVRLVGQDEDLFNVHLVLVEGELRHDLEQVARVTAEQLVPVRRDQSQGQSKERSLFDPGYRLSGAERMIRLPQHPLPDLQNCLNLIAFVSEDAVEPSGRVQFRRYLGLLKHGADLWFMIA